MSIRFSQLFAPVVLVSVLLLNSCSSAASSGGSAGSAAPNAPGGAPASSVVSCGARGNDPFQCTATYEWTQIDYKAGYKVLYGLEKRTGTESSGYKYALVPTGSSLLEKPETGAQVTVSVNGSDLNDQDTYVSYLRVDNASGVQSSPVRLMVYQAAPSASKFKPVGYLAAQAKNVVTAMAVPHHINLVNTFYLPLVNINAKGEVELLSTAQLSTYGGHKVFVPLITANAQSRFTPQLADQLINKMADWPDTVSRSISFNLSPLSCGNKATAQLNFYSHMLQADLSAYPKTTMNIFVQPKYLTKTYCHGDLNNLQKLAALARTARATHNRVVLDLPYFGGKTKKIFFLKQAIANIDAENALRYRIVLPFSANAYPINGAENLSGVLKALSPYKKDVNFVGLSFYEWSNTQSPTTKQVLAVKRFIK